MDNLKKSINVCVAALIHGQHDAVKSEEVKNLLIDAADSYNVLELDRVYGSSPDDWHPFNDRESIRDYIEKAGFEMQPLTSHLYDMKNPIKLNALIQKVQLYILDPLFLALEDEYSDLIARLDGLLCEGRKYFCIAVPQRLPTKLRVKLLAIRDNKFQFLKNVYYYRGSNLPSIGEFEAESAERLSSYLNRIYKFVKPLPLENRKREFNNLLGNELAEQLGFLIVAPKMIQGAT